MENLKLKTLINKKSLAKNGCLDCKSQSLWDKATQYADKYGDIQQEIQRRKDIATLAPCTRNNTNEQVTIPKEFIDITSGNDEAPSWFLPCGGKDKGFRLWIVDVFNDKTTRFDKLYILEFVCFDFLPEGKELFRTNDYKEIEGFINSIITEITANE
jgi:hypothetical protein